MLKPAAILVILLSTSHPRVQGDVIRYNLSTATTNPDTAVLVSGFFETDGTIGSELALSGILTDYSVTISELGQSRTLDLTNSSVTETGAFFDVSSTEIFLPAGPEFFRGLTVSLDGNPNVRLVAIRTGGTADFWVSVNSGVGSPIAGDPLGVLIGSAPASVPEPSSLAACLLFAACSVCHGVRRKRREQLASRATHFLEMSS